VTFQDKTDIQVCLWKVKLETLKKWFWRFFFCKLTVLFCDEVSEAFSIAQKNRNQLFFNKKGKKTIFKAFNWDCLMWSRLTWLYKASMSISNHCAGRTLSFETRKTYSGPQFRISWHFVSIFYTYFSQFQFKMEKSLVMFNELLVVLSDSFE